MHTPRRKLPILVLAAGLACAILAGVHAWMYRTPGARLAAGETYPEMREDASHHYIDLPVDHAAVQHEVYAEVLDAPVR